MNSPYHTAAAFTHAVPLTRVSRATLAVKGRPFRPALANVAKKTRAAVPAACIEKKDEEKVERGLTFTRTEILQRTRSGRALRIRRWATLSEIEVPDGGDTRVDVWMVISRDRRDFRVRGKVVSQLLRVCDRCAKEYTAETDGRFEVILRTGDAKLEGEEAELVEAVEEFGPSVGEVWLGDHVRDGVYLGMPTRSLCRENCGGVEVRIKPGSGSVRYEFEDAEKGDAMDAGNEEFVGGLGKREAGERLMELKRRLEKEGL